MALWCKQSTDRCTIIRTIKHYVFIIHVLLQNDTMHTDDICEREQDTLNA